MTKCKEYCIAKKKLNSPIDKNKTRDEEIRKKKKQIVPFEFVSVCVHFCEKNSFDWIMKKKKRKQKKSTPIANSLSENCTQINHNHCASSI